MTEFSGTPKHETQCPSPQINHLKNGFDEKSSYMLGLPGSSSSSFQLSVLNFLYSPL